MNCSRCREVLSGEEYPEEFCFQCWKSLRAKASQHRIRTLEEALSALNETHCSIGCSHEGCESVREAYEEATRKTEAALADMGKSIVTLTEEYFKNKVIS